MKKMIIAFALIALPVAFLSAQDRGDNASVTTKRGHAILPAAGDFALGIEATPFLYYAGNMLNGNTGNSAPSFDGFKETLYGKYFLTDKSAVRGRLAFDFGTDQLAKTVGQDDLDPLNPDKTVVDYRFKNKCEVDLYVGYEMRRGYRRLQGFYGAEAHLGFNNNGTSYKYGNQMTVGNQSPSSWNFEADAEAKMNSRPVDIKDGLGFRAGVNGFVGVEYFVAPKISLGGELGVDLYANLNKIGTVTNESYNASAGAVVQRAKRAAGSENNIHFETVTSGSLFVLFHF